MLLCIRRCCAPFVGGVLALLVPLVSWGQLNVRWDPMLEPGCGGWSVCSEISPYKSTTILIGGDIMGTGLSTDGGWNWQQPSGFDSWEFGDYTWHPTNPQTIWAATIGGPYLSTDGGLIWTSKRTGMPTPSQFSCSSILQKIVFDPNNPNTLLAFGGSQRNFVTPVSGTTCYGAVWKSTNSGANWTKISTIAPDGTGVTGANIHNAGFVAGSSTTLLAATYGAAGVYKSTDGGVTWSASNTGLPSGSNVWNLAFSPTDPNTAWVTLDNGGNVFKTINGGANWTSSSTGIDTGSIQTIPSIAVSKSNPNVLYCGAQGDGSHSSTYISTNGGANWSKVVVNGSQSTIVGGANNPGDVVVFKYLTIDPNDPTHVIGNTQALVLESWNSGATWYDLASFTANGNKRGSGYAGWACNNAKWNPYKLGQLFPLAGDAGKMLRTSDWGYSVVVGGAGASTSFNGAFDVGFAPNGIIYLGTGQFGNSINEAILRSANYGSTWSYISRPSGASGDNRGIYVDPSDSTGNTVYSIVSNDTFGSPAGALYRTTNGGSSWSTLLSPSNTMLFTITADPVNYHTIYVAAQNGVYKSTDGTTFNLISGSPTTTLWSFVHLDPNNSGTLYDVAFRVGDVQRYDGTSWKQIFAKYAAHDIAIDPNNSQRLAIITHGYPGYDISQADGVWISTDGGNSWNQYNTGLRMLSGSNIEFNPDHSGQLIVGTDGAGYYVADLGTSTPFTGTVPSLVGTMQAENYDAGGYNIAYHNSGPAAPGGDNYRSDNLGIKAEGTGHALTHLVPGEWIKYSVNVPSTGYYDITLNVMSTTTTPQFHVEMNGVNVTGPIAVGNTSGVWKNITARGVRLIAGNQYLKLYCEGAGADVDYLSTQLSTTGISITSVTSGAAYAVGMSSLGATAYIDQPYVLSTLTPTLRNLPMIQTASSDATSTAATDFSFSMDQPGTVYVAMDKAITTLPSWISGWTLTSESVNINNGSTTTYNVYSHHYIGAGTRSLGGNLQSPASGTNPRMYLVFIKRD